MNKETCKCKCHNYAFVSEEFCVYSRSERTCCPCDSINKKNYDDLMKSRDPIPIPLSSYVHGNITIVDQKDIKVLKDSLGSLSVWNRSQDDLIDHCKNDIDKCFDRIEKSEKVFKTIVETMQEEINVLTSEINILVKIIKGYK